MAKQANPPTPNIEARVMDDPEVKEFFADPKAAKFQKCVRAVIETMQDEEAEKTRKDLEDAAKKKPKGFLEDLFGS